MYWFGESSIIQGEIFKYLDHNVHHYSYPMSHFVSQYNREMQLHILNSPQEYQLTDFFTLDLLVRWPHHFHTKHEEVHNTYFESHLHS